jgi:hypothetical protein
LLAKLNTKGLGTEIATARSIEACGLPGKGYRYQLRVSANKMYLETLQRSPVWAPGPIAEVGCGCNLPAEVACPEASRFMQALRFSDSLLSSWSIISLSRTQCDQRGTRVLALKVNRLDGS